MTGDTEWVEPTFDFGYIDREWVVLRRGACWVRTGVLPAWHVFATCKDIDHAREIVAALVRERATKNGATP